MLTEERQDEMVRLVTAGGSVSVQELVDYFQVSEATVRRDLSVLNRDGRLRRVHGGATALPSEEGVYEANMEELEHKYSLHMTEKRRIAQYAASCVTDSDFVYLDAGSTVEQMADFLKCDEQALRMQAKKDRESIEYLGPVTVGKRTKFWKPAVVTHFERLKGSGASFLTNSLPLAQKLARNGISVHMLPGHVRGTTASVVGSELLQALVQYHFTYGFFGTNGISLEEGCTTPDAEEAAAKAAAFSQCRRAYILADGSKFGLASHITFAPLTGVSVITARSSRDVDFAPYKKLTEVHVL